ncbi:ATP-binding cassette domain-containing protein [Atopobacter sp. AH10]|uniref:ABC transporter ATP-binding protein n=1 Tax=Atopobacter sp. AH10 TaxID=2315861 RepID=UPI000EF19631|nr:ATP-binding cassette domain-containing protein [Atopobacter sp. AH10]RLK62576.1 ATP-binding cassette domain-containing protein [Atopobacter sp. AH10]
MIEVKNVSYDYKVFEKSEGFVGAIKDFFNRQYEFEPALSHIDLQIERGEMIGLLGPNGAGKTTLIKIMTGILATDKGSVLANGYIPYRKDVAYLKEIGVVLGQKSQLIWDLPAKETLSLLQVVYGIDREIFKKRLEDLTQRLNLSEKLNIPVRKLSMGERVKFEIICALIHSPQILFLDEPTIGLDLPSQVAIRQFLKEINQNEHTTVIITSHNMQDIENLCERVIVLIKGSVRDDLTIEGLKKKYTTQDQYVIEFKEEIPEELTAYKETENSIRLALEDYEKIKGQIDLSELVTFQKESESFEEIIYRLFKENA